MELDARPWRCMLCKADRGAAGTHYYAPTGADVENAVPDTLTLERSRDGGRVLFSPGGF